MHIRQRLKPFSHSPGTCCLIPGTTTVVRAYPTRLEIGDEVREFEGFATELTLEQDLEKGRVLVRGEKFREEFVGEGTPPPERLSLGSHKKQDWDLVKRRCDLKEILPIWFRLGQWTPVPEGKLVVDEFLPHFLAHFEGILVPTGEDRNHYGVSPIIDDPLLLLTEGARAIRALFFREEEALHFSTPREFHCGRMMGIQWALGSLDFEWSRHKIRRVMLTCEKAGRVHCRFPKEIKRFRLHKKERLDAQTPFDVSVGDRVLLDRFEK